MSQSRYWPETAYSTGPNHHDPAWRPHDAPSCGAPAEAMQLNGMVAATTGMARHKIGMKNVRARSLEASDVLAGC
eukprot:scaffold171803_cov44-Prasinocladus_malaysianus.AAC.1